MFSINNFWTFQVHGGGHGESKLLHMLNELLLFLDTLAGKSGGEIGDLIFPGIAQINNFHPLIVHFPIAMLVMFFVVDTAALTFKQVNWRNFASGALYAGTAFAGLTVYLGYQAAEAVAHDDVVHAIMERHETLGVTVLCLALILSAIRWFFGSSPNLGLRIGSLLGAALLNILLFLGADLGGLMVYHYGVAVNAVLPSLSSFHHQHSGGEPEHEHVHAVGEEHSHQHHE